jgi:hypothetical protein
MATQNFTWNSNDYITWTFATPVLLAPNTLYGVDVGMTSSTSAWQTGIPYLSVTATITAGGVLYNSGTSGIGTATISAGSNDRVFHLDLEHPMAPSPNIGATVPAGDLTLSWTNLAPTTGTDVWVDVWFGTDPGTMTKVANAQQNLTSLLVNLPGANTYYWRVDSYLDGAPPARRSKARYSVSSFRQRRRRLPGRLRTAPHRPALRHRAEPRGRPRQDGITNWDEYRGAAPTPAWPTATATACSTVPASPSPARPALQRVGDGILFTDDVGDRTFRGEAALGTDPLKADTDGDGLPDGVETNTGVWVSAPTPAPTRQSRHRRRRPQRRRGNQHRHLMSAPPTPAPTRT